MLKKYASNNLLFKSWAGILGTAIFCLLLAAGGNLLAQASLVKADNRNVTTEKSATIPPAVSVPGSETVIEANTGYLGHYFGSSVAPAPTGEKPESKLWWNDNYWWGSMWNPAANQYQIYRFNLASQVWETTGTSIDNRSSTKADALWDGNKLYIASHVFAERGGSTGSANSARLYRYSYNTTTKQYTLDSGFPVLINSSTSETLVIDKDSTGKLWITWMQSGKVMINSSTTDDLHWSTPIRLPVQTTTAKSDDISTIQHFDGNKIGLMWSDQTARKIFFAVHIDGNSMNTWQSVETALADGSNPVADDHINLKMGKDGQGNVYAVTKTSLSDNNLPQIYALKRDRFGNWSKAVFGYGRDNFTRPILLIDESNNKIHVFVKAKVSNVDGIYTKNSDLDNISFPSGVGTPFIKYSGYNINDPTSTKQTINNAMGLVVLAGDHDKYYYFHNAIAPTAAGPLISSFSPASGVAGTVVTLTGSNFSGATAVKFNGVNAASFTVVSGNQIQATVPAGASTGLISVTTPQGSGSSSAAFVVITAPQIAGFSPVSGAAGAQVTVTGSGFTGATAVTFNNVAAGSFTVNSDNQLQAVVPVGATTGRIRVTNPAGAGTSASNFTVLNPPVIASFSPASGTSGALITLTGNNFSTVSAVRFNGVLASSFIIDSNTQIRATVPAGATSGPISATNPDGTGSSAGNFTVLIPPQISSFTPASGPSGTLVTISGAGFTGTTAVKFNGIAAAFAVISDNQIQATVPANANSGPISVTNAIGTGTSAANFTVPEPPFVLTVMIQGNGRVQLSPEPDLPGGAYSQATPVIMTAFPDSGYLFSKWSGDLLSFANPETLLVNSNKIITAEFIEEGSGGPAAFEETRSGGSISSAVVATADPLTLVNGDLYLAAISTKAHVQVSSVNGLGLNWVPVREQCGGRLQTGVSVWMARGNPSGSGIVTATLAKTPQTAVITVSRYSGAHATEPLGTLISANTNGLNGACSDGSDGRNYLLDLATTAPGSVIFGAVAIRNRTHTPGAGYTERSESAVGSGGSMVGLAIVDQTIPTPGVTPLNGSFSSDVDWAVIGIEIKSGGAILSSAISNRSAGVGGSPLPNAISGLNSQPAAVNTGQPEVLPEKLSLSRNYPNPFNMETTIEYALPQAGPVKLAVYNILGQQVRLLVNETQEAGYRRVTWNGRDDAGKEVTSGVYFIRLNTGQQQVIGRMIVQK